MNKEAEIYCGLRDGSYTCQAWDSLGTPGIYIETETNEETIAEVKNGKGVGVIPIYNNHGGYVNVMSLIYKELKEGKMFGYYSKKVAHVLASLGENPKTIIAHPQALIQSKEALKALGFDTRYLLKNMQNIPKKEGNTIIRIEARDNKVGVLAELLEKLAESGLNLDYINSVPTGNDNYLFDISLKITDKVLDILKANLQNIGCNLLNDEDLENYFDESKLLIPAGNNTAGIEKALKDPNIGVICPKETALKSGLRIIKENVAPENNQTEMALITNSRELILPKSVQEQLKTDKTVSALTGISNKPGSLAKALKIIAENGLGLSFLLSVDGSKETEVDFPMVIEKPENFEELIGNINQKLKRILGGGILTAL